MGGARAKARARRFKGPLRRCCCVCVCVRVLLATRSTYGGKRFRVTEHAEARSASLPSLRVRRHAAAPAFCTPCFRLAYYHTL